MKMEEFKETIRRLKLLGVKKAVFIHSSECLSLQNIPHHINDETLEIDENFADFKEEGCAINIATIVNVLAVLPLEELERLKKAS